MEEGFLSDPGSSGGVFATTWSPAGGEDIDSFFSFNGLETMAEADPASHVAVWEDDVSNKPPTRDYPSAETLVTESDSDTDMLNPTMGLNWNLIPGTVPSVVDPENDPRLHLTYSMAQNQPLPDSELMSSPPTSADPSMFSPSSNAIPFGALSLASPPSTFVPTIGSPQQNNISNPVQLSGTTTTQRLAGAPPTTHGRSRAGSHGATGAAANERIPRNDKKHNSRRHSFHGTSVLRSPTSQARSGGPFSPPTLLPQTITSPREMGAIAMGASRSEMPRLLDAMGAAGDLLPPAVTTAMKGATKEKTRGPRKSNTGSVFVPSIDNVPNILKPMRGISHTRKRSSSDSLMRKLVVAGEDGVGGYSNGSNWSIDAGIAEDEGGYAASYHSSLSSTTASLSSSPLDLSPVVGQSPRFGSNSIVLQNRNALDEHMSDPKWLAAVNAKSGNSNGNGNGNGLTTTALPTVIETSPDALTPEQLSSGDDKLKWSATHQREQNVYHIGEDEVYAQYPNSNQTSDEPLKSKFNIGASGDSVLYSSNDAPHSTDGGGAYNFMSIHPNPQQLQQRHHHQTHGGSTNTGTGYPLDYATMDALRQSKTHAATSDERSSNPTSPTLLFSQSPPPDRPLSAGGIVFADRPLSAGGGGMQYMTSNSRPGGSSAGAGAGTGSTGYTSDPDRSGDDSKARKRLVWTPSLHARFLNAINSLEGKAVPKAILSFMNVDGLTRENVASHLQKYRLNKAKQKEESGGSGGSEGGSPNSSPYRGGGGGGGAGTASSSSSISVPPGSTNTNTTSTLPNRGVSVNGANTQGLASSPPGFFGVGGSIGGIPMQPPPQRGRGAVGNNTQRRGSDGAANTHLPSGIPPRKGSHPEFYDSSNDELLVLQFQEYHGQNGKRKRSGSGSSKNQQQQQQQQPLVMSSSAMKQEPIYE